MYRGTRATAGACPWWDSQNISSTGESPRRDYKSRLGDSNKPGGLEREITEKEYTIPRQEERITVLEDFIQKHVATNQFVRQQVKELRVEMNDRLEGVNKRLNRLDQDVNYIKTDVTEIKDLMYQLVEGP